MLDEQQLRQIAQALGRKLPCRRVLLFGSYARGDAHQGSDVNLCVVVEGGEGWKSERWPWREWPDPDWVYRSCAAKELVEPLPEADLDIHVLGERELEQRRQRQDPFVLRILEEGRSLYEQ
jgi:predicted nucleotidyltransferase